MLTFTQFYLIFNNSLWFKHVRTEDPIGSPDLTCCSDCIIQQTIRLVLVTIEDSNATKSVEE